VSGYYCKKPIRVEARQLLADDDGRNGRSLAAWCGGTVVGPYDEPLVFVPTLEGELRARAGDWIVKGPHGEFWPVKGAIFAETYEPCDVPAGAGSARDALFGFVQAGAEEADLPSFAAAVDAYRAEVFDEAAALLRNRAASYPTRRLFAAGLRHGALRLAHAARRRAGEVAS